jgi:hypothetical protein
MSTNGRYIFSKSFEKQTRRSTKKRYARQTAQHFDGFIKKINQVM